MLKPGDGLLYKGCELIHGREKFKGTECLQVFLHYVTNKKYKYRTYVSQFRVLTNVVAINSKCI